jgi:diguanylate cyclase (GGDEF)-like protein
MGKYKRVIPRNLLRRQVPVAFALLPAVATIPVLLGWLIGNADLTHLWLSRVPMNPLTALALLCLSGSVRLGMSANATARAASTVAALLVTLVTTLRLAADLAGTSVHPGGVGFAILLFGQHLGVGGQPMSLDAAVCLLLICAAMPLARRRSRLPALAAQATLCFVVVLSIFAVVGYLFDVPLMQGGQVVRKMAPHTALALIALATSLLMTSRHGLASLLTDRGVAGGMIRTLLPATLILPIVVGGAGLIVMRSHALPDNIVMALMVVMNVALLTGLVALTAAKLMAADFERRHVEMALTRLAKTDMLTSLPNRVSFMEHLSHRMSQENRAALGSFAVVYLDLDGFKSVNDSFGHAAGDQLLRQVGKYLRMHLRPNDIVARLGGDEFAVVLDGVTKSDEAAAVVNRMVSGMPRKVVLGDQIVWVGISAGVAISEPRHATIESILNEADEALYSAKNAGRNRCHVPTANDTAQKPERKPYLVASAR